MGGYSSKLAGDFFRNSWKNREFWGKIAFWGGFGENFASKGLGGNFVFFVPLGSRKYMDFLLEYRPMPWVCKDKIVKIWLITVRTLATITVSWPLILPSWCGAGWTWSGRSSPCPAQTFTTTRHSQSATPLFYVLLFNFQTKDFLMEWRKMLRVW